MRCCLNPTVEMMLKNNYFLNLRSLLIALFLLYALCPINRAFSMKIDSLLQSERFSVKTGSDILKQIRSLGRCRLSPVLRRIGSIKNITDLDELSELGLCLDSFVALILPKHRYTRVPLIVLIYKVFSTSKINKDVWQKLMGNLFKNMIRYGRFFNFWKYLLMNRPQNSDGIKNYYHANLTTMERCRLVYTLVDMGVITSTCYAPQPPMYTNNPERFFNENPAIYNNVSNLEMISALGYAFTLINTTHHTTRQNSFWNCFSPSRVEPELIIRLQASPEALNTLLSCLNGSSHAIAVINAINNDCSSSVWSLLYNIEALRVPHYFWAFFSKLYDEVIGRVLIQRRFEEREMIVRPNEDFIRNYNELKRFFMKLCDKNPHTELCDTSSSPPNGSVLYDRMADRIACWISNQLCKHIATSSIESEISHLSI